MVGRVGLAYLVDRAGRQVMGISRRAVVLERLVVRDVIVLCAERQPARLARAAEHRPHAVARSAHRCTVRFVDVGLNPPSKYPHVTFLALRRSPMFLLSALSCT